MTQISSNKNINSPCYNTQYKINKVIKYLLIEVLQKVHHLL